MKPDELTNIATLIRSQRSAALGTLQDGAPFVSFVAYAPEPDFGGFLLHLSRLSPHTRHLANDPHSSLMIAEPDDQRDDVQTLARITLTGAVASLPHDTPEYVAARSIYLARLPAAAMLFDFADFGLYRYIPDGARYVGGFARAYTLTIKNLQEAALV
ncbi:MAG: pyridoxamine 5'-phosphate oxidase family protein [Roseiflexaceae bacterium]|nr:pyridoxamine 5'-phosphate oxidase family protein [Roseiflexaceae bacterium]